MHTNTKALLVLGMLLAGQPVTAAQLLVDISASNWKFTPSVIETHVGETVMLRLKSMEGVHGIVSDGLGISKTIILPGRSVGVVFTPKKAGTYQVHCAIPCGEGHENMFFTVKVDP